MNGRIAAVTGATGFLGRHLVRALAEDGWRVRILARRDPIHPLWADLEPEVVPGHLADPAALAALCDGAQAVVHAAAVLKASPAAFRAANVEGARAISLAARDAAPQAHLVLVSSLAAREPQLSDYAASKRAAETAAAEVAGARLSVVRPPVIYGPGDRETLPLFQAADRLPLLPVFDPRARIALIHVQDAARQVAALAAGAPRPGPVSLSDARPEGYGWRELMGAAQRACGRPSRLARAPDSLVGLAGAAGGIARFLGAEPMLTPGKAREVRHLDWSVSPAEQAADLPPAAFGLLDGFTQTVAWCRQVGWLWDTARQRAPI